MRIQKLKTLLRISRVPAALEPPRTDLFFTTVRLIGEVFTRSHLVIGGLGDGRFACYRDERMSQRFRKSSGCEHYFLNQKQKQNRRLRECSPISMPRRQGISGGSLRNQLARKITEL